MLQNGTVMAWGNNGSGQLGNGTETSSDVAVAVSGLTGAMAVAGGGSFSLALLSNGEVRAWGNNAEGELGDANPAGPENCGTFMLPCSKKPVAVCAERSKSAPPPACIALTGVMAIAAGETHSLALLSNGTVLAWGTNNSGQLGDGTSTGPEPCGPFAQPCSPIAVEVDKASGAKGIAGGGNFSVAFGPPPTVTALNPTKGSTFGGTKVGISGEDFTGATKVKFGSAPAVSFTVLSPTSISATAPAGSAGTVDVTVTNAWGTSATGSADQYTYVQGLQELPELGRCVKVAAGTGAYRRANCLPKSKTHTGEYEWLPGPGANKAFELKLSQPAFETVKGQRVVCAFLFAKGEFTGSKTLKISGQTQIQGCALQPQNLACYSNPLEPNQIVSEIPLVGELGFIPGATGTTPFVGLDLKAESELSKTMFEFKCGESGVFPPPPPTFTGSIEGSVIGRIKPTNKMVGTKVFALVFTQEQGIQKPTAFIGGVEDVLTQILTPTLNPTNPKTEQAGMSGGGELVVGEIMEIKAKQL